MCIFPKKATPALTRKQDFWTLSSPIQYQSQVFIAHQEKHYYGIAKLVVKAHKGRALAHIGTQLVLVIRAND